MKSRPSLLRPVAAAVAILALFAIPFALRQFNSSGSPAAPSLPVSTNYLALALANDKTIGDLTLRQKPLTDLRLPTGKLVACDAFLFDAPGPFELPMPAGTFPVVLGIAHFSDGDQRVAFATIRFRDSTPVTWTMLTVHGQNPRKLNKGEIFGYGVDSGTGCFIDASAAKILEQKMTAGPTFFEPMIKDMERTSVSTWSWLDMPVGDANLVTFSSGFGDGGYATYAGFDTNGVIALVVTDFAVVPFQAK